MNPSSSLLLLTLIAAAPKPDITADGIRWSDSALTDRPGVIVTDGDTITRSDAPYQPIDGQTGKATVRTPGGSAFEVVDRYAVDGQATRIDRVVKVITVGKETGFRSELAIRLTGPTDLKEVSIFVPGIWYADGQHTPPSGMVQDIGQADFLFREDRLPLPVVTVRNRATGQTLSLVHTNLDGSTTAADTSPRTMIDDRFRYGSLGVRRKDGIRVVFDDPGVEGDQTRVGRFRPGQRRAERFRPVKVGTVIEDHLIVKFDEASTDDNAMRLGWRAAWDAVRPPVAKVNLQGVFDASIGVLDHYGGNQSGTPGFPFAVQLPSGKVRDVSLQMGFVGEQIPCAAILLDEGFRTHDAGRIAKGTAITDFWADHTLSDAGVPRVWYDVKPKPHWRDYPTYTRIATDGMRGMLRAYRIADAAGVHHPSWLDCCRRYGDWLVEHQGGDGTFVRAVDFSGKVVIDSPSATTHPIRFLLDLAKATKDDRYRAAAVKAGQWAVHDIGRINNYYGGTADNKDVIDKEAGWIALDSFLSLFEATDDRQWLDAAARAGTFTETWVYGWNVPIPTDDPANNFPKTSTTAGMSLIAVGHSGSDVFMAFGPFAYLKLATYTGDNHFAEVARVLMYDTRQFVDVGGSLGYGVPGLVTEAISLAPPRGHGVNVWLPWCTAAIAEPMVDLRDCFGTVDIDAVLKISVDRRHELLRAYDPLR